MLGTMTELSKRCIKFVDPWTVKSISNSEYYLFGTKDIATKFYSSIGLWNILFVNRLYQLDESYARDIVNQKYQSSDVELALFNGIEDLYYYSNPLIKDVYNYLWDKVCDRSNYTISDYRFKSQIRYNESNGIYFDLNLSTWFLEIYGYSIELDHIYMTKEYSKLIDQDTLSVLESFKDNHVKYSIFYNNVQEADDCLQGFNIDNLIMSSITETDLYSYYNLISENFENFCQSQLF